MIISIDAEKASIDAEKYFEKIQHPFMIKILSEICTRRNTSKFILQGHHYPDIKTKDNTQKRKLQANNTDEHRCKNPQHNFSKQNSATHQKAHTP